MNWKITAKNYQGQKTANQRFFGRRLGILLAASALGMGAFGLRAAPGDLDPSLAIGAPNGEVRSIVIRPDGKFLMGGIFSMIGATSRPTIGLFSSTGVLDTSFSTTPSQGTAIGPIAVLPDGKILIGGSFTSVNGSPVAYLARLNADGSVDPSFALTANSLVLGILPLPDGKILIWGFFSNLGGLNRQYLARLNPDGSVDTAFAPTIDGGILAMAVQPDGKVLISGFFSKVNGITQPKFARLNVDGTLDAFDLAANGDGYVMTVQPDGKILIGGSFTTIAGAPRINLARVNADGTIDTSFSPNPANSIFSLSLQADGKILVGGFFNMIAGVARASFARLHASGAFDGSFVGTGVSGTIQSVSMQADGRIFLGGFFSGYNGVAATNVVRILNDAATGVLAAASASRVTWLRGGSAPEAHGVSFELSTDRGSTFTPLGEGTRIPGGWELTGLNLPQTGMLRARAFSSGGQGNGSSSLFEAKATYSLPTPAPTPQPARPTLKTKGKTKLRTNRPSIDLAGSSENATRIEVRIGTKGKFKPVKGNTRNWKVSVKLKPGKNRVSVRSVGPGGTSPVVNYTITRRP